MRIELIHPVTNVIGEVRLHDDPRPTKRSITALIDSCVRNDVPFRCIVANEMHMFGPQWLRACMVRFEAEEIRNTHYRENL
jgi:hypothetical protein